MAGRGWGARGAWAVVVAGATLVSRPLGSIRGTAAAVSRTVTERSATAVAVVTRLESPAGVSSDRVAISSVSAERFGTASAWITEDRGRRAVRNGEDGVLPTSATEGVASTVAWGAGGMLARAIRAVGASASRARGSCVGCGSTGGAVVAIGAETTGAVGATGSGRGTLAATAAPGVTGSAVGVVGMFDVMGVVVTCAWGGAVVVPVANVVDTVVTVATRAVGGVVVAGVGVTGEAEAVGLASQRSRSGSRLGGGVGDATASGRATASTAAASARPSCTARIGCPSRSG